MSNSEAAASSEPARKPDTLRVGGVQKKGNDMRQAPGWVIYGLVLVVVMHVLAGCGNTDTTQASSQPASTAPQQADTEQVTLRITGMS